MEAWFAIILSLCIAALIKSIFSLLTTTKNRLPPGPASLPFIGNAVWLRRPISDLEFILRRLKPRYGPLITMKISHRFFIYVGSHSLAHQALVQNGAVFADRPGPPPTTRFLNRPQKAISSSPYGATWRLLRRNLTHEILHPSRVRGYATCRQWVLSLLIHRLRDTAKSESSVKVIDHFQYAMFCLLVFMCFGDKLEENQIKQIEDIQRRLLLGFRRFNILNLWPRLGRIIFRNRWRELIQMRGDQDKVLIPLIRARIQSKQEEKKDDVMAYVDTLQDLHLPEENRKLHEEEMVSLCSEFLSAGTDTTSTALQWIIANLVKYPQIQNKLYQEIKSVAGEANHEEATINEEELQKLPYLKAVVLEGLRRHPPGHFVLPHKVSEDVELDGYTIPKDAVVNFMVADMGWDPNVWEDPMEFRPERFVKGGEEEEATNFHYQFQLHYGNLYNYINQKREKAREREREITMTKEVGEGGVVHQQGKDYVDPPPAPFLGVGELKLWSFYRALIAEFIATLLFLYVTVATVIGHKKLSEGDPCDGVGLLGIAWAFGGMIFILVYCTAGISGGHINPAVTLGLFLARKVSLIRAVTYMISQCLGAICGVGLVKAFMRSSYNRFGGGANTVATGYNTGTAVGAEIIGTFVLVYTVFSATDPKRSARDSHVPVLAPLPIGFAVFMVHLATIPITGTGINPARSFGAAVMYNNQKSWDDQWIFWVGPFGGAIVAAIYHQFILRAGAVKALGSFRSNPTN